MKQNKTKAEAAPASCGQHTTLESGEPIQSCLVAIANEMGGCDSSADLAEVVNLVDKLQGERDQLREDKAELQEALSNLAVWSYGHPCFCEADGWDRYNHGGQCSPRCRQARAVLAKYGKGDA